LISMYLVKEKEMSRLHRQAPEEGALHAD